MKSTRLHCSLSRWHGGAGALFIVNDHADIAAAVDADGVHLGQDDLPIEHAQEPAWQRKTHRDLDT